MPFWFDPHPVQTKWRKEADILLTARSRGAEPVIITIYLGFIAITDLRTRCVNVTYSAVRHHFT